MGDVITHGSPNFGPRRHGLPPDMVVLHYTAMHSCDAALARLCDPHHEVSAHYLISESGVIYQLVDEEQRAWHAGAGRWGQVSDVNSHSIGIELANKGPLAHLPDYPAPQMASLELLLAGVMQRWQIRPERVIGHSDMAVGRKIDPGPRFDWQGLAASGLAIWPNGDFGTKSDPAWFREFAHMFGYSQAHSDDLLLAAFRLRFRAKETGPMDAVDLQIIQNLARRFPVDGSIGDD